MALPHQFQTGERLSLEEAQQVAAEMSALSGAQREALQKAPVFRMSHSEREAYDRRRARIAQLVALLLVNLESQDEDVA